MRFGSFIRFTSLLILTAAFAPLGYMQRRLNPPMRTLRADALMPHRIAFMQRLQDAATNGYTHYAMGTVTAEKWEGFASKMAGLYDWDCPKSTRAKRKRKGQSVVVLYAYTDINGLDIHWCMPVTGGTGIIHGRERLLSFSDSKSRIVIDGYQLTHDGHGWSWRMTKERLNYWRERITEIAQRQPPRRATPNADGSDPDMEQIIDTLFNAPGFRLVRQQVGELYWFAKATLTRHRGNSTNLIKRPFLPFVRRMRGGTTVPVKRPPRGRSSALKGPKPGEDGSEANS